MHLYKKTRTKVILCKSDTLYSTCKYLSKRRSTSLIDLKARLKITDENVSLLVCNDKPKIFTKIWHPRQVCSSASKNPELYTTYHMNIRIEEKCSLLIYTEEKQTSI